MMQDKSLAVSLGLAAGIVYLGVHAVMGQHGLLAFVELQAQEAQTRAKACRTGWPGSRAWLTPIMSTNARAYPWAQRAARKSSLSAQVRRSAMHRKSAAGRQRRGRLG
jgi:hypothetical protein